MSSPAPVQELERYFTTDDIAERYHSKPSTVRYWRQIGYGPRGTKVGRRYLYSETEVRRFDAYLTAQVAEQPTAIDENGDAGPCTSDAANGTPSLTTSNQ